MLVKKGSMLILSLVLFLLFTNGVSASSSEFPDVSKHWASEEINKWVGQDLIKGYSDGTFRPDSSITRAEFIVLVNKIFNYKDKASLNFNDVGKQDWFSDDMAKAVAAGLVKGDSKGNIYPDTPITRQEVSVILYQAFKLKVQDHGAINKFSDADQIASWSRDAVNALLENGFIQGRSEKIFAPQANITRGEAVKMIDRVTGTLKNIGGTYSGDIPGNLVVNTQDVVLKDMKISGNLFLTEGIGDGTVRLDNVTVQGQTFVNGGGDHSVVINNSSLQGILYVYKSNGQVRILAEGSTYIPNVQLGSGANLESENASNNSFGMVEIMAVRPGQPITLDGDFTAVYLEAAGADLRVVSGSVGTLFVGSAGTGANIEVETNANIATLTADGRATVSGPGTIATANINTNGVTIESKPVKTNLASGVTAEIGGITTTGSTLPASSGGDGGSSTPASPDQDIASAKALLPGTFYAVEGTDLNIIHSLGNITGIAATSVTLAVYSTGNSQVSSNGVITYGGESVTGNVTISLAKAGGTTDKKVILVIIPAHISPTASGILYIDTDRWVQGDTGKLYLVKL